MSVFAVIAPYDAPQLKAAVEAKFGNGNHYVLGPGQYVVYSASLTTQQVAEALGVPDGGIGRVAIFRIENYGGWHARDLWEWIATHLAPIPPAATEAQGE